MKTCFFTFRCKCKENRALNIKIRKLHEEEEEEEEIKKPVLRTIDYPKKFYLKRFEINYPGLLTPKAKFA